MKLSTGKVGFPIEFDNGDKAVIYFNPNDRGIQERIKGFEESIEKRIKADNDVFGAINKEEFDLFVSNNQDGNLKELCKQIHEQIMEIEKTK